MKKITIEKASYKWFDMKLSTYDKLEIDGSIYLYYDGDKYAEIRIFKKREYVYYHLKLYEEFCQIIPISQYIFERFMSKWVEDTFNFKGFALRSQLHQHVTGLKIPNYKHN